MSTYIATTIVYIDFLSFLCVHFVNVHRPLLGEDDMKVRYRSHVRNVS